MNKTIRVDLICPVCEKAFSLFPSQIHNPATRCCSRKCMGILQRRSAEKPCAHCGKMFRRPPAWGVRTFCSRKCYYDAHAAQYVTKACATCGKAFEAKQSEERRHVYCSDECRKATHLPRLCGVYAIRSIANDMIYIGSTNHIHRRWRNHKSKLRIGTHENPHLQIDYDTFGVDNFVYEVLELVPKDGLHAAEQKYLDDALKQSTSYNVHPKADSPSQRTFAVEQKAKISQRLKGRTFSEEHRRKLSAATKGRPKPRRIT